MDKDKVLLRGGGVKLSLRKLASSASFTPTWKRSSSPVSYQRTTLPLGGAGRYWVKCAAASLAHFETGVLQLDELRKGERHFICSLNFDISQLRL